jgi:hypothetical protein
MTLDHRQRARDAALRRTRAIVASVAAGAVALSGLFAVVAAQAFKGHQAPTAAQTRAAGSRVPGPDSIPSASGDDAPLQPPAQPPAAADPQSSAPEPQVSGGS